MPEVGGQEGGRRKTLIMKELPEASGILADCMLLTAWIVFSLGAGIQEWPRGSLKLFRGHLPPPQRPKGPNQLSQEIESPESTETEVEGKRESLWQQFASLCLLCLHFFPSFLHPGALFQRPLPWSVSKSLARSKLLTPVLLLTFRQQKRGQGPSWGKGRAWLPLFPSSQDRREAGRWN